MFASMGSAAKAALVACTGVLLAAGVVLAVEHVEPHSAAPPAAAPASPRAAATRPKPSDPTRERLLEQARRCEKQRESVLREPALPGAPGFERARVQLVARAKGEPLYFVQTPQFAPTTNPEVLSLRAHVMTSGHAWGALASFLASARWRPKLARAVLLRDGYLYSEDPNLAFALASQVKLEDLFVEPEVWIQRGERTLHARKERSAYVFVDGPNEGEPARLLSLDRVGTGTPGPALHRDLRALRYRMHCDSIRVERATADHLLASVRYGSLRIETVLGSDGAALHPECQIVSPEERPALEHEIAVLSERDRVLALLRAAIIVQIDEGLPFDEPKTEIGQEDGALRKVWRQAYLAGRKTFRYNDDRYRVFDAQGRPRVPQVCLDFLTDTLERASGTWWRPEGEARERIDGGLDFDRLADFPRRRVEAFVQFAKDSPRLFDVLTIPPAKRIELGYKKRFFANLAAHADDFRAGDIVVIRGPTPWDDEHQHYHSFFVYETDPVTGVPIAIAGNAGKPAIWTWEAEARRTPHRSVWYRIRPRLEWLTTVLAGKVDSATAPVLARGGS